MAGETTNQNTANTPLFMPKGSNMACRRKTFEITTGELQLNDVIACIELPAGALIVDGWVAVDDLDSNGSPALVLHVGTGDDPDGLLASSSIGQAGGFARFDAALLKDGVALTVNDTVDVKVATAAATAQAGTVTLCVMYINDDDNLS